MIVAILSSEKTRFGIVAITGLAIDMAVAWSLASIADLALPVAATAGFVAGAVTNYFLHELWTFRGKNPSTSASRGLQYAMAVGITLGIRVAAVGILAGQIDATDSLQTLFVLLVATIASFGANYILSKYWVFRRVPQSDLFAEEPE